MKYITAVPASAGLAVGTVRYLRHTQSGLGRAVRSPKEEQEAFENAVREAQDQLIRLERRAAAQDRDIFMVQRVLLEDEGLRQEVASYIRVGAVRRHRWSARRAFLRAAFVHWRTRTCASVPAISWTHAAGSSRYSTASPTRRCA
ncbi:MAG: phosphoenolpyruvate-utilizing N-terminal domain-containing protein [Ruthenibacterium lactatiformans]